MKHSESETNDEVIGRLIKSAGPGPTLDPAARSRMHAAVGAEWRRVVQQRRMRQRWTWLAAAAGLAAVALIVRVQTSTEPQPAAQIAQVSVLTGPVERLSSGGASEVWSAAGAGTWVAAGDTLRTGVGGRIALAYVDGPVLRVDAASELRFEQPELVALTRGAVYVDSGSDAGAGNAPADALVVRTAWGAVRHVGTQYEVRVADTRMRVRVREGAVVIGDLDDAAREFTARAGEEIVLADGAAPVRAAVDVRDPDWRWAVDLARVQSGDAQTLHALLGWFVRETGQELRFSDAATEAQAQSLIVHGVEGLTPVELLGVIRSTTTLQYTDAADSLLVSSAP